MKTHNHPRSVDTTAYCRALGYQGKSPVRVLDGKVITHRNICWYAFCQNLPKYNNPTLKLNS